MFGLVQEFEAVGRPRAAEVVRGDEVRRFELSRSSACTL